MPQWVPDDGQRKAIEYGDGPLAIRAGAGTGKTSTVMHRIDALVDAGVDPSRILAITFTEKAAMEMKLRLSKKASRVRASTIHAFCLRLLHRYHRDGDGRLTDISIMDEDERRDMLKDIVRSILEDMSPLDRLAAELGMTGALDFKAYLDDARTGFGWSPDDPPDSASYRRANGMLVNSLVRSCGDAIGLMYNGNLDAEGNWARVEREVLDVPDDDTAIDKEGHRALLQAYVARLYEGRMRRNRSADFDFILRMTYEMLRDDSSVCEAVQRRYDDVFVDEYQDTSKVQVDIVEFVAGQANLVTVGDPDQSIYSWRGAVIGTMDDFVRRHGHAEVVNISVNHRSTQAILDAANAVIADNPTDVIDREELSSADRSDPGRTPILATYDTDVLESAAVANDIRRRHLAGVPWSSIAVLMRVHALGAGIARELRSLDIPYTEVGVMSFYERRVVKDILAYLTVLYNPLDDAAFLRVLNTPRRGLGPAFVDALVAEQGSQPMHVPLYELMRRRISEDGGMAAGAQRDSVERFVGTFTHAYDHGFGMVDIVESLIGEPDGTHGPYGAGYRSWIAVDRLKGQTGGPDKVSEDMGVVDDFLSLARGFDARRETKPENATAARRDVAAFCSWISTQAEAGNKADADVVSVMTVHAAKGLEFDTVYLLGADDGIFPSGRSLKEGGIEEERRLMYVALTRARRRLVVTHVKRRRVYGQHDDYALSRLLQGHQDKFNTLGT